LKCFTANYYTIKNLNKATLNNLLQKTKTRWGIQSNRQFLLILFVFAITGPTTLFVERFIFDVFNIPSTIHWLMRILFFIVITMPVYKVILLFYGLLFGQFTFFWNFVKAFISKFFGLTRLRRNTPES
jgi:hypothetical protein